MSRINGIPKSIVANQAIIRSPDGFARVTKLFKKIVGKVRNHHTADMLVASRLGQNLDIIAHNIIIRFFQIHFVGTLGRR